MNEISKDQISNSSSFAKKSLKSKNNEFDVSYNNKLNSLDERNISISNKNSENYGNKKLNMKYDNSLHSDLNSDISIPFIIIRSW